MSGYLTYVEIASCGKQTISFFFLKKKKHHAHSLWKTQKTDNCIKWKSSVFLPLRGTTPEFSSLCPRRWWPFCGPLGLLMYFFFKESKYLNFTKISGLFSSVRASYSHVSEQEDLLPVMIYVSMVSLDIITLLSLKWAKMKFLKNSNEIVFEEMWPVWKRENMTYRITGNELLSFQAI